MEGAQSKKQRPDQTPRGRYSLALSIKAIITMRGRKKIPKRKGGNNKKEGGTRLSSSLYNPKMKMAKKRRLRRKTGEGP